MRIRDLERAIRAVEKAAIKINEMNKRYPALYVTELQELGKSIIAQWYASYDPIFYDRTRSLYKTYDIRIEDGEFLVVDFDAEYMNEYGHRVSNSYIYENSFEKGFHGGADKDNKKNKHPNPGIPYWRTPIGSFQQWGRPAIYTFSPYQRMNSEMRKKIKQITKQGQAEYDKVISRVENAVNKIL